MITILAGSRTIDEYRIIREGMKLVPWRITRVVSGCCRGPDKLGERWAHEHGIPVDQFPAKWSEFGKRAGYLRNEQMAGHADALVAFFELKSAGTQHMINLAKQYSLELVVIGVDEERNPYLAEHRPMGGGRRAGELKKRSS